MYLDNSLNKLLPSCLLLPLLLRVISVLIVFLSIWSHCFSGLFLCYFPSTKINYKYPFELGVHKGKRGASRQRPRRLPSPALRQLMNVYWECDISWYWYGNRVFSASQLTKIHRYPRHHILPGCHSLLTFCLLQHSVWHGKWAQPNPLRGQNPAHQGSFTEHLAPKQMTSPLSQVEYLTTVNAQGCLPKSTAVGQGAP